jgi:cation diffusion facilitator family transporter
MPPLQGAIGSGTQALIDRVNPRLRGRLAVYSRHLNYAMDRTDFEDDAEHSPFTPAQRSAAASRSTWVSVGVNLVLSVAQIVVGIWSKSQGLVADGMHTLSDLVADFVVLFANHHSQKDADEDHPYGHQRFETAASLVLGLLLLAVGLGMLWSAAGKLQAPESIATVHITALWVAGGALVAKELLFRYMLAVAKQVRSSMLVANAWHARSDAASSLVVGVGIIGNLAGYPILDPIAAAIVGFMVTKMGWSFAWDAMHDLMDRAVDEAEVQAIRQTLAQTPGVSGVHDVRTRKMGDMIVVDAHLEVLSTLSVEQGHDIAVVARQRVMKHHRVINLMTHIDPYKRPDLDHTASATP